MGYYDDAHPNRPVCDDNGIPGENTKERFGKDQDQSDHDQRTELALQKAQPYTAAAPLLIAGAVVLSHEGRAGLAE